MDQKRMVPVKRREWKKRDILAAVFLFAFFLSLLLVYIGSETWFVDENDNFLGAMVVARGGDIYKDFCSQHMPVMYYLCAVFYLLGARTVIWYRVYFAVFSAVLWTAMYFRYNKAFGKATMLLGPVLYAAAIGTGDLTYQSILSDKLQTYGMVILFLEFLWLYQEPDRHLSMHSCCWISFAIFISFGSAFVSIFGVFAVAVGVLVVEWQRWRRSKRLLGAEITHLLDDYGKLIIVVAAPFALLLLWYACTGNLRNFYHGAYLLNTRIYSKYTGGYGTSVVSAMLQNATSFFLTLQNVIRNFSTDLFNSVWMLGFLAINIAFVFYCALNGGWMKAALVAFILFESSPRGYFNFHSMAYFGISAYMGAILFQQVANWAKRNAVLPNGKVAYSAMGICICVLISPVVSQMSNLTQLDKTLAVQPKSNLAAALDELTLPDEKIGCVNSVITAATLVEANRSMVNGASSTPWTCELWGQKELSLFEQDPPRIVLYNADYTVWEYAITSYAPEMVQFIESNYTNVGTGETGTIWARNDYANTASQILNQMK
jgi:hypothetical protein